MRRFCPNALATVGVIFEQPVSFASGISLLNRLESRLQSVLRTRGEGCIAFWTLQTVSSRGLYMKILFVILTILKLTL